MMENSTSLSDRLTIRIDRLIHAYEHLKSENQMLRDELQVSKDRLQQQEIELLENSGNVDIKESEIETIIEKLETALGNH